MNLRLTNLRFMNHRLATFWRDCAGTAMTEFALVLPLMVALFCGAWELSQAVICYLKLTDAANTVVDIAAQQRALTASNIDDIYTAAQMTMVPDSGTPLGMAIASVKFDPTTGAPAIAWQQTRGGMAAVPTATIVADVAGLGNKGDSVIVGAVTYQYASILKYVMPTPITLATDAMQRPRLVASIPLN